MVKKKQRKAALFLVICMVLSVFNGIPVQAGEGEQSLKIAWAGYEWDDNEEKNIYDYEEWMESYGSWPGNYLLYIADAEEKPVESISITPEDGVEVKETEATGYFDVTFMKEGDYTIFAGSNSVDWRVDWPKFAFYNDAEGTEYKIDAEYTTAEGASFYIVARADEDEDNSGQDDTLCTITVDSSIKDYITIGNEEWEENEDGESWKVVMAAIEEPKEVIVAPGIEGEFDINLSWPVDWSDDPDTHSIHCYEKPTGLVATWVTDFDWEDEEACAHEEDFWKSTDGCWMGYNLFYLAYLSEEGEEEPVTEVSLQYESEAPETVEAIYPGYFELPLHKLGKYTVTYTTDDGETSKVTIKTVRPGDDVAFYRNESAEERLVGVTYQRGTPTTFYAVPNTENRSVSYKIVPQDGSDGYVTVTVDGEEVPEDEFITDEPAQVTISAKAKGEFELKVEGIVTYDGEDAEEDQEPWELASIWISEAKTGLLVSWDYDWSDDVPVLNENPWYEKEIWTDGGVECYFGYRESEEEAAEPATLTLSNITYEDGPDDISTLVEIENMEAPGFYRFNFRKPGDYTITYKGSSVSVYVDMPEVGFYSAPEKTYENLMTGNETYSFLKASKNIAANKIYLNIGDRELYDEAKHGELGWDEDTHYAFEMQLVEWDVEHDDIPHLYYGADGQPADAEGAKYKGADYLEVKSLGNSWYELQFKTGDLKVTNEDGTTWEPDTFLLCVITAGAWENEDGELMWDAWDYNGWFTGKYVALEELKIATPPTKTTYTAGETFDPTGMVVKAVYEDGTEKTVTDYTMTPSKDVKLTAANTFVRITYADGTVDLPITVKAAEVPETPETPATPTEATPTEATTTEAPAVPDKGTPIEDEKKSDGSYTVSSSDSANPTVEYKAPKNKNAKEAKIPDTIEKDGVTYKVTSVAPNAFKGNKTVTKVTIGNNVTTIGKNAFSGCTKLKTVTIGKNVTTIGASAFKGCSALTKVTIPAKTTKIGKDAFNGCKKLKTVTIGKNVTTIEANAFKGCSSLTKITLPGKTTKIGKNAFSGCKNLKTITIKSTKIKSFTKGAFNGLSKDTVIKVPKSKKAAYATLLKKAGFKGTVK